MNLQIKDIFKRFGRFPALNGVSLEVQPGEFLALLGPSGSGKTTLLRVLAGLETPDSGTVGFEDQDFLSLTPREKRVGMVFQHYALFRHMSVAANVAFGLNVRPKKDRPRKAEIAATVDKLLSLVRLEGFGKRFPAQLSGGQRQRVALARALAIQPRVLLLDEPFGALDAKVRRELRRWLREIHDETGVTTIFVTHDQEEALDMADRVAILRLGQIQQIGKPESLHEAPASAFVFEFLGDSNHLPCRVEGGAAVFEGFTAPAVVAPDAGERPGAWFRPHETLVSLDGEGLEAVVSDILIKGAVMRVECRTRGGLAIDADVPRDALPPGLAAGASVRLRPKRVFVFPIEEAAPAVKAA